jgi:hypothetical protein
MRILIAVLLSVIVALPSAAQAVTLSLTPASGEYGPGETFVVTVRLDSVNPEECVNVVDLSVLFPKDLVKPVAVSRGESLLTLWPEEPSISLADGLVRILGGIPGGYCGRIVGDPGQTNILAKIIFAVPGTQIGGSNFRGDVPMRIGFSSSTKVLLNDGSGTPATVAFRDAVYTRLERGRGASNEWLDAIRADTVPPDAFRAEIVRDRNAFDGKYMLVFSTVDKQSGVSHYEVLEEDPVRPGYVRGEKTLAIPVRSVSPYLLRDQELKSRIIVRAFDHAGNRTESVVDPTQSTLSDGLAQQAAALTSRGEMLLWSIAGLVLVAVLVGVVTRMRHAREGANSSFLADGGKPIDAP